MKSITCITCTALLATGVPGLAAQQATEPPVVGRWDITVTTRNGAQPAWLGMHWSGDRTLVGQIVYLVGSARPISRLTFSHDTLRFTVPPQWEQGSADLQFEAVFRNDQLSGWVIDATGDRHAWTGRRAPSLLPAGEPQWGAPIRLFNGADLTGWKTVGGTSQWKVVGNVLTNVKGGANLVTQQTFDDFKLHVEFRYPPQGNSGVYLRGRYEVQVEDTPGTEPKNDGLGGVYGFLMPNQNAAKGPGQWQTYDITLVGRVVTVELNGKRIICASVIPGITGGALDSREELPGPIMLQGDHGPIEYRNVVLTPAKP